MSKNDEFVAGKDAAVDDLRHKTMRDVSIYPSAYYQDGYREAMAKHKERNVVNKSGGK